MANKANNQTSPSAYDRFIQNGYYSYSSQAYKLNEAYPLEDDPLPSPRPARRKPAIKKKPKQSKKQKVQRGTPKAKTVLQVDMQNHRTFTPMTTLLFATFFIGLFSLVFAGAYVQAQNRRLSLLQADLRTLKQENNELEKDLYEGYDLLEIERIATAKLNMSKPEEHQIRTIYVPKQSYNAQYESAVEETTDAFSFAGLLSLFIKD